MMGGFFPGGSGSTTPPAPPPTQQSDLEDPLEQPLQPGAPVGWEFKERRVQWCLHNLTPGEKAYLYRLLHSQGIRLDACLSIEKKERV